MSLQLNRSLAAALLSAALTFSFVPAASAQIGGDFTFNDGRSDNFFPHFGPRPYDPHASHFNEGFYDIRPPGCSLSERRIRNAFRDAGYRDVRLNVPRGSHVQVRASKDGWVYLIDYNFCSGRITGREQLNRS